ncbi:hypothetical protein P9139_12075 [Curtobacterium flaccumfaciens]|nr:hypothetical protein P9139_12075 [Curtobacterium flaccumfaciens]
MRQEQERRRTRAGRVGAVVWPIVVAAAPTAAFQLPNLVATSALRVGLVVFGLVVLVAAVLVQVVRARRAESTRGAVEDSAARLEREQSTAVRYAFGQLATRLVRFTELRRHDRRSELPAFADRVAVALAFYLLPKVPDVRANVYQLLGGPPRARADRARRGGRHRRDVPRGHAVR